MTPNKEDYLKCIYEIGIDLHKITNKEIAARMQVSPPAVTEMIKRMKSENLILKDKECGYLLTDLGLKLVSELYRKHRLIEVFLVHHLDYTADIKEAGAYRLTRVHDSFDILHYLDKHSLHIGDQLQVKQFDGFSNTFTILSNDEDLQVNMDIAKQLYVEKIN
ncbi:TPA: metal-dependent transcriptional regulator [Streptococcus pneumoniae]|nr:metal-dependent transcriptional regulator [Streptococcus pneumoniae]HEW7600514.1 metal-dependent transcriptional regulator [Streptococcus pneumoniae]